MIHLKQVYDFVDYSLILTGLTISLENVDHIIGIISLSLNIVWLLFKLIVKAIGYIKKGIDLDGLDGIVDQVDEEFDRFLENEEGDEANGTDKTNE